ncbi:MAG: hypothetical protein EOM91_24855, partial [Sphingobacteriia bacterium]|nr:hypothetical protein [Sphingobacteriia bacterium]
MAKAYEIKLRVDANGKAAVTELTRVEKKVGDVGKSAKRATSEADILTRGFASMGKAAGAALGAIGFGALVRGFVSVSAEQDRFRRGFEAISASSAAAAAELAYVSEVSARLGLEVSSAT